MWSDEAVARMHELRTWKRCLECLLLPPSSPKFPSLRVARKRGDMGAIRARNLLAAVAEDSANG